MQQIDVPTILRMIACWTQVRMSLPSLEIQCGLLAAAFIFPSHKEIFWRLTEGLPFPDLDYLTGLVTI